MTKTPPFARGAWPAPAYVQKVFARHERRTAGRRSILAHPHVKRRAESRPQHIEETYAGNCG